MIRDILERLEVMKLNMKRGLIKFREKILHKIDGMPAQQKAGYIVLMSGLFGLFVVKNYDDLKFFAYCLVFGVLIILDDIFKVSTFFLKLWIRMHK
jgi:UDP-N-acetylmuramyl pentapeptide phosphotransferase/UDP-N-acetylglucosamine-1-phosphate transferase